MRMRVPIDSTHLFERSTSYPLLPGPPGPAGHRHLLGVTLAAEESEASWFELLPQLTDRGLTGVELVIADEHPALAAAVRRRLPEAKRQRCTVHLQRNVLTKAPQRLRKRLARRRGRIVW